MSLTTREMPLLWKKRRSHNWVYICRAWLDRKDNPTQTSVSSVSRQRRNSHNSKNYYSQPAYWSLFLKRSGSNLEIQGLPFPSKSTSLGLLLQNLFQENLLPSMYAHLQFGTTDSKWKALYFTISTCTRCVCHLLMTASLWREARNAASYHESAQPSSVLFEESMIFLWFLNLVLHIWCCTVFICLVLALALSPSSSSFFFKSLLKLWNVSVLNMVH